MNVSLQIYELITRKLCSSDECFTNHVSNDQGGYVRCMFDVIEENSYYDLRPGVERFFDSVTGFEPKTFDPHKDYYTAREKVLRVVEIDGKIWSEVEWTVYHGDWNPVYNYGTPVTKPKQLYTTVSSAIEYFRVEGSKLIQWTEVGEKVVFDFDIKLGDNIYQKTSPYVDLDATALDINTSASINGTVLYEFEVEFGFDRKPTIIKFGDSSSDRVPAEWELKSEITPDLRLLIPPNYYPNINKPVLPFMQVERIGVVYSPFNHRGLYLKGFTDFKLQYIEYPTYGQSVYNFASTPVNKTWECGDEIKDIEGNRYRTVLIGTQCWMADNLTTSRYKN